MTEQHPSAVEAMLSANLRCEVVAKLMGVPVGDQFDLLRFNPISLCSCEASLVGLLNPVRHRARIRSGIVSIAELAAFAFGVPSFPAAKFAGIDFRFSIRADDPKPVSVALGLGVCRAEKVG